MTYALIAAIEGSTSNLNTLRGITQLERKFEEEAVLCFEHWRKNGGWLKDIPIYAFCPTTNVISTETKAQLSQLGVTYIEEYQPITEQFTSGFLNVPLIGSLLEQRIPEEVLIKVDLDMNLIRPIPPHVVNNDAVVCGQYDDYCTKQQRSENPEWGNPFDTGFIVSKRSSGFYQFYFNEVLRILNGEHDPNWEAVKAVTGEYYLEEYVMDKMYHFNMFPITPIQRYQVGEWYTPVKEFTDEQLVQVYFWHEHIVADPAYNKIREKVEFFNRMRQIEK